jgi:nicotinate-nucleotide--dimethylbenzimidazole phosphoribosyltransferase
VGVGSTTHAAAVAASLFDSPAEEWAGAGTAVDEEGRRRKVEVVEAAVQRIGRVAPLEVLRQVGGSEMVVIAGACLEARLRSIPVLLDGLVVAAAVAPLEVEVPGALDHCLAAHVSEEAHQRLLDRLDKRPLLDLGLRWGEASGALAAVPLVRLAAHAVVDVATVDEWGLELS